MKKPNILHISTAHIWRGAERQIVNLYKGLSDLCDQTIVCPEESPLFLYCKEKNINVISYKMSGSIQPLVASKMAGFIIRNSFDLIHIHDSHGINLYLLSRIFGVKCEAIITRRVDFEIGKSVFSLWKYNHNSIRKIICISEEIKNIVNSKIKDKNKTTIVYSGIDLEKIEQTKDIDILRKEYNISKDKKIIGTAAALVPHKDILSFIATAKKYLQKDKDAIFFIIGEGEEKDRLYKKIEEDGLQNDIIMTGFKKNILECIKNFDLFLFTSTIEGLSTTLMDVMAIGIPLVATKAGGAKEILIHNKNALVAEPRDTNTLALHLLSLINDDIKKEELTSYGKEFVVNFDYKIMAQKNFSIYKEILEN